MANPKSVKILETTRVTPSFDSPISSKELALPLTFLDISFFKFPPFECVYFYQLTESTSTPFYFSSEILPRLKQSLSLSLLHYLPMAGYFRWPSDSPKPIILYTPNDGISLTVAESNAQNFNTLSGSEAYKANELHPLVPKLMISDDIAAVLSLQITLFPGQGFSIGTTAHRAVVDGKVATMFMKSWAYLCKQGNKGSPSLPPELTPYFDRSVIKDPTRLDLIFLNDWLALTSSDSDPNKKNLKIWGGNTTVPDHLVRATFHFTREDIKKLEEKVLLNMDADTKQLHLSTFVLACAYTGTCLVKAKGGEGDRPVIILFAADWRTRLAPPLPTTYFGNCDLRFKSSAKASNFMDEKGFLFAVHMLSDLVGGLKKRVLHGVEEKVRGLSATNLPGLQK
ncbi:hypothetical protein PTKIN_Ptkin12aG0022200 [Pterospermum kingtungense]